MRAALALATAVAGSVLGVAGPAAPAQAEVCIPPDFDGFRAQLDVHRITCHHGNELAHHLVRDDTPHGWSCTRHHSPVAVTFSCHAADGSDRRFHLRLIYET